MKKIFLPIITFYLLTGCGGDIEQKSEIIAGTYVSNTKVVDIISSISNNDLLNSSNNLISNELVIKETQSTYENNMPTEQSSYNNASNPLIDMNAENYRLEKVKNEND